MGNETKKDLKLLREVSKVRFPLWSAERIVRLPLWSAERREAVLWVAISSSGTIAGVCALHTVHGFPLEDLQQLKKVWKLSSNP
ncbi:hypothetical protein Tco_1086809 [Tanacetum coccineum]